MLSYRRCRDVFKRMGMAVPSEADLIAWMRNSVKKSLEQNYHSLNSDNVIYHTPSKTAAQQQTSSPPSEPYSARGGGGGQRGSGRGSPTSRSTSSPSIRSSNSGDVRPVCRDWANTGSCPRGDSCRFDHPRRKRKD